LRSLIASQKIEYDLLVLLGLMPCDTYTCSLSTS